MRGAALAIVTAGLLAVAIPGSAPSPTSATTDATASVAPGRPDLPVAPVRLPTYTVLDAGFNTGFYTDLVLDGADRPVVTYYDDTASALVLVRCHDPVCRERTRTVVDEEGHTGLFTSVVLAPGDLPVISYYDLTSRAVRLASCRDASCGDVVTATVNPDAPELTGTAIDLDPAGRPVVAYRAGARSELWLSRCPDRACDAPESARIDGPGVDEGIAIELSEAAVTVVYRRDGLRLASCRLPCEDPTIESLDRDPGAGFYPSILSGTDGLPVVTHLDFDAKEVDVIRCHERTCRRREATTVEAAPLSGFFTAPVLDGSDRAQVAFFDEAIEGLVLVSCRSVDCGHRVRQVVDPTPLAGQHLALASGPGGLAIAYHDGSVRNLRLVRCAERTCRAPPEGGPPGRGIAAAQGSRGPMVVYRTNPRAGVRILRCLDASCGRADATAADDVASLTGGPDVAIGGTGSPLVVFQNLGTEDLRLTSCPDRRCPYLEGATVADGGSVGHRPRIVATAAGLGVVHRDETARRIELIVCAASGCVEPSRISVAATDGVGGAMALAGTGEELVVAYHDDRSGRLRLRTCRIDGCRDASTLAPTSLPEPLTLAVDPAGEGVHVAVVHRDARHRELELLVCELPCADPVAVPLPAGARFPSIAWRDGAVQVVHGLGSRTVRSVCDPGGCGPQQEVLAVTGPTAFVGRGSGDVFVAVLAEGAGVPALASCDDRGCRSVVPELVPTP